MREVLFRGRTTGLDEHEKGEWVYGNVIFMNNPSDAVIFPFTTSIAHGDIWGEFWWVDPETIGQRTEMKDLYGKDIFEGDIVHLRKFNRKEDTYEDHNYVITCSSGTYFLERCGRAHYYLSMSSMFCDVIGNIHDNPELLTKGELKDE